MEQSDDPGAEDDTDKNLAGVAFVDLNLVLALAGGLVEVNCALVYLGAKLFQRAAILTRWK